MEFVSSTGLVADTDVAQTQLVESADNTDSSVITYTAVNSPVETGYYAGYYGGGFNDGTTVTVYGTENYTVDLSSGYYYPAINIDATYSSGMNYLFGDSGANVIIAGMGNSALWGSSDYESDLLIGGWGYDTFYCGKYEGNDMVLNGGANDTVWLYNTSFFDIIQTTYDGTSVGLLFNTGTSLFVACTDLLSPAFLTAEGGLFVFNRVTGSWQ